MLITLTQYSKGKLDKEGNESANQILNKKIATYNQFSLILNKVQDFDHNQFFFD